MTALHPLGTLLWVTVLEHHIWLQSDAGKIWVWFSVYYCRATWLQILLQLLSCSNHQSDCFGH